MASKRRRSVISARRQSRSHWRNWRYLRAVKSPSKLAPTRNFAAAERRAQVVLSAMVDADLVKDKDAKTALIAPPKIVNQIAGGSANYVADYVKDALAEIVGNVEADVIVETSVDAELQAAAEKALTEELAAKGEKLDAGQGALIAMTPQGAVRALVGGRNYSESQFNRAVAAKRQPGLGLQAIRLSHGY